MPTDAMQEASRSLGGAILNTERTHLFLLAAKRPSIEDLQIASIRVKELEDQARACHEELWAKRPDLYDEKTPIASKPWTAVELERMRRSVPDRIAANDGDSRR